MEETRIGEVIVSSIVSAGGVGTIAWYLIKRLITRIDKLDDSINSTDPKNPGLRLQMELNIKDDAYFVKRFEEHLSTHKGIKNEVQEILKEFEVRMDQKYKLK